MISNPNDPRLVKWMRQVEAFMRSNPLRRASVDRGRVRMMNGSELLVEGLLTVIGQLLLEGDMDVVGGGSITVGGVVITPLGGGKIQIGSGIILDAATQTITVGGSNGIVLDAAAKRILVGGPSGIVVDAAAKKVTIPGTNPIEITTDGTTAKIDLGVADVLSNGTQAGVVAGNYWAGAEAGSAFVGQSGGAMFIVIGGVPKVRGILSPGAAIGTVSPVGVDQADNLVRMSTPV